MLGKLLKGVEGHPLCLRRGERYQLGKELDGLVADIAAAVTEGREAVQSGGHSVEAAGQVLEHMSEQPQSLRVAAAECLGALAGHVGRVVARGVLRSLTR